MLAKNNIRFSELDSLRGIGALSVVLFHYTTNYPQFFGNVNSNDFSFKYGFYGVPLFFIISGFVIFMTVNKVKSPFEFVERRLVRLYPTFWLCMILTFIGVNTWGIIPMMETTFKDGLLNLTMFYRILRVFTDIKDVDRAYWSLLPELQFYFLIFLVFIAKQIKYIKLICLLWFLLIISENFLFHIKVLGLFIDLQFGGFFIAGILFYKITVNKENDLLNHLFIIATLFMNVVLYMKWEHEGALIMLPLIYSIFYLFAYGKLVWLKSKILLFFGAISYPLYLIHQNLGYAFMKQFEILGFSGDYMVIITIMVFTGIAALITYYFEKPFLRFYRNKITNSH